MRAKRGVEKSTCVDSTTSFTLIGVGVRLYMEPKNVNVTKFGNINAKVVGLGQLCYTNFDA